MNHPLVFHNSIGLAATTAAPAATIREIAAPDFYWQYRLARLVEKKGAELAYDPANYPEMKSDKDLYDAYYLDLTLQGKMDGFDWRAEKEINDSEWKKIYKSICAWTQKTAKENKSDTSNLPSNDFDLLKQFWLERLSDRLNISRVAIFQHILVVFSLSWHNKLQALIRSV